MFIWDYSIQENGAATLFVAKVDKGVTHKIVREDLNTKSVLFWLKHYERLDLDSFKLAAKIDRDLRYGEH